MKIDILGTKYEIVKNADTEEYPQLKKCDGFTDFSIKKIVVANFDKDENSVDDLEWYKNKVLRHEIVHAFIHESGLAENCEWARNEELTDWIAIQFEKIIKVFLKVGVISSIGIDINDSIIHPEIEETKLIIKRIVEMIKTINNIPLNINFGINKSATGEISGCDEK